MFQLTTSRRGRRRGGHPVRTSGGFNSRPHEEVDVQLPGVRDRSQRFNSRPHEEVDHLCILQQESPCTFQLTTSRRGRRQRKPGY